MVVARFHFDVEKEFGILKGNENDFRKRMGHEP